MNKLLRTLPAARNKGRWANEAAIHEPGMCSCSLVDKYFSLPEKSRRLALWSWPGTLVLLLILSSFAHQAAAQSQSWVTWSTYSVGTGRTARPHLVGQYTLYGVTYTMDLDVYTVGMQPVGVMSNNSSSYNCPVAEMGGAGTNQVLSSAGLNLTFPSTVVVKELHIGNIYQVGGGNTGYGLYQGNAVAISSPTFTSNTGAGAMTRTNNSATPTPQYPGTPGKACGRYGIWYNSNPTTTLVEKGFQINTLIKYYSILVTGTCNPVSGVGISGTNTYCLNAGASALSSSYSGGTATAYQWYANGSAIGGATGSTYTPPTNVAGTVNYTVKVTNACGNSTSANYPVTVNTAPSITGQPANQATCGNGTGLSYSVTATGSNLSYLWYYSDDGGTTYNSLASFAASYPGYNTATMTTNSVQVNGRKYRVVVSNSGCAAATSSAATVTLNTAPSITSQPANKSSCTATANGLTYLVTATGSGLSYQWYYSDDGGTTYNSLAPFAATYPGQNTATLTTNGTEPNGRKYRAVVTNSCSTVTSSAATFTLNSAPAITVQPANKSTCIGSPAVFSVGATGTGLTYQWQYSTNGGSSWANTTDGTASNSITSGSATATLSLTPTNNVLNGVQLRVVVSGICTPAVTSGAATMAISTTCPGPGGVPGALEWLRADNLSYASGTSINSTNPWTATVGGNAGTLAATGTAPTLVTGNVVNFNPVVRFSGSGGVGGNLSATLTGQSATAFQVLKVNSSSPDWARGLSMIHSGAIDYLGGSIIMVKKISNSTDINGFRNNVTLGLIKSAFVGQTANSGFGIAGSMIVGGTSAGGNTLNQHTGYLNGTTGTSVASGGVTFNEPLFGVGAYWDGSTLQSSNSLNGDVPEVIIYPTDLTATQRQQVNSYLALKYGITMSLNYLATNGTTVTYDRSTYGSNIAGIGRDDITYLNQKQGRSLNASAAENKGNMITMGLGSMAASNAANANIFGADMSYNIWGDDGGSVATIQTADLPSTLSACATRLPREWKVQRTGTGTGAVQVQVDMSSTVTLTGRTAADFILLIDRDGDGNFTTGTVTQVAATSYASNIVTFNNVTWDSDGSGQDMFAIVVNQTDYIPAYTVHPASQQACVSGTLSLNSNATAVSAITYKWQYSTDGGGTWNTLSNGAGTFGTVNNATAQSLYISGVTAAVNGVQFRSVASTGCAPDATASNAASITLGTCTYPGGVAGQSYWFKADAGTGTTTNNAAVSGWTNQTPGAVIAQAQQVNAANQPTYLTLGMNFNPTLSFNGTNNQMLEVNLSSIGTPYYTGVFGQTNNSQFGAFRYGSTFNSGPVSFAAGHGQCTGARVEFGANAGYGNQTCSGGIAAATIGMAANLPYILNSDVNAGSLTAWLNGVQKGSAISGVTMSADDNTYRLGIGGINNAAGSTAVSPNTGGNYAFGYTGQISEMINYPIALTATQRQQVASYLAVKYGQTEGQNYLATDGTTVTYNISSYGNNIAGIGRDDVTALNQRQSQSVNTANKGNMITMALGNGIATLNKDNGWDFGVDKSYIIWGDDAAGVITTQTADLPSALSACATRLPREWKVQRTNNGAGGGTGNGFVTSATTVQVDMSSTVTLTGRTAADFILLIDRDGDGNFTTGTVTQVAATSYASNIVTFNNVTWDSDGSGQDMFAIVVNQTDYIPAYTVHPASQQACTGTTSLALTSTATAVSAITYKWQYSTDNGANWNTLNNGTGDGFGTVTGATTQNITISNVQSAISDVQFRSVASTGCAPDATASNAATITYLGACKYPGGVPGPIEWVRADKLTYTNGTSINSTNPWTADIGGNAGTVTNVSGTAPTVVTGSVINFNPVVRFTGSLGVGGSFPNALTGQNLTAFQVLSMNTASPAWARALSVFHTGNVDYLGGAMIPVKRNSSTNDLFGFRSNIGLGTIKSNFIGQTTSSSFGIAGSMIVGASSSAGNTLNLHTGYINGATGTTASFTGTVFNEPYFGIGAYWDGSTLQNTNTMNGDVPEAIIYPTDLTATQRQQVNSYLAMKYGITMPVNYLATNGTTTTYNISSYGNNIAGIGRDDITNLNQKQSRSLNASAAESKGNMITMALGTIAADNASNTSAFTSDMSYMVWGDDAASVTTTNNADLPAAISSCAQRLPREWKVQRTGSGTNAVQMQVDMSSTISLTGKVAADFSLLIDRDGDGNFATGTQTNITAASLNNGVLTFNDILWDNDGNGLDNFCIIINQGAFAPPPATVAANQQKSLSMPSCPDPMGYLQFVDVNPITNATRKYVAIKPNGNTGYDFTVTQSVASNNSPVIGNHMVSDNATNTSALSNNIWTIADAGANNYTANGGMTVRIYYDPVVTDNADSALDNAIRSRPNPTFTSSWFKYSGTSHANNVAAILSSQTTTGISGATMLTPARTGADNGLEYVEFDGITSFSSFGYLATAFAPVPLPVKLSRFTATSNSCTAILSWQTASEQSLDHFVAEWSTDAKTFYPLQKVSAKGSDMSGGDYSYQFDGMVNGSNYFRLKMADLSGRITYSRTIAVVSDCKKQYAAINVSPNPAHSAVTVSGLGAGTTRLLLTDAVGRIVNILRADGDQAQLDISSLPSGIYLLQVRAADGALRSAVKIAKD